MNLKLISIGIVTQLGLQSAAVDAKDQKMNVLFIAVDDLKPILGCYGNKLIKTPNIDRLAKQGTVFLNNYCQQAVSGPSRASLMTGMRPDYTQIWDLATKMRDVNPDIVSLPQYLIMNGYTTSGLGKIYDSRCVDRDLDKPSWSIPFYKNNNKYFSTSTGEPAYGYQSPETKRLIEQYRKELLQQGIDAQSIRNEVLLKIKQSVECVNVPDNAYIDGANALFAVDVLSNLSKKSNPFFLAVGFSKPHLPFVAPQKYWDLYNRDEIPLSGYREMAINSPDIAYHTAAELRSYSDIPELISFTDQQVGIELNISKQKELIHGYYASISYIDAQVGLLLNTLDSLGIFDNTIIVLFGDHGFHLGDHNLWCKHSNFEQATHAPLIISSPRIKGNMTSSPSEFVDIFPTLCELNGLGVPPHLQGNSLVPVMKNPKKKVKNFAVSQYPRSVKTQDINRLGYSKGEYMGYSIRTERYRYTIWMKDRYRSTQPYNSELLIASELYDYKKDPDEKVNVLNEREYRKISKQMHKYMTEYLR